MVQKHLESNRGNFLFLGMIKNKPRQNLTPVPLAFHKTLREGLPTTKTKEEELLKTI